MNDEERAALAWQERAAIVEHETGKRSFVGSYCCPARIAGPCSEHRVTREERWAAHGLASLLPHLNPRGQAIESASPITHAIA